MSWKAALAVSLANFSCSPIIHHHEGKRETDEDRGRVRERQKEDVDGMKGGDTQGFDGAEFPPRKVGAPGEKQKAIDRQQETHRR